jgi:hypothetical protein
MDGKPVECGPRQPGQRVFTAHPRHDFCAGFLAPVNDVTVSPQRECYVPSHCSTGIIHDASLNAMASL